MSERLFARLAARLAQGESVALAAVVDASGATPRRRGALMLIGAGDEEACPGMLESAGSVGGGEAEARVLAAARALLGDDGDHVDVAIDLSGRPGAAGVCGGRMAIAVRAWKPSALARAQAIAATLAAGVAIDLSADDVGANGTPALRIDPDPRLLIVGAGHCGRALCRLARELDYDVWVHDTRASCFDGKPFEGATVLCGDATRLAEALATPRPVFVVLLNRDYAADVAALEVIVPRDSSAPGQAATPAFLGMMGSRRRVAQVRAALPHLALAGLVAPVGLDIGAQTPAEIAVSILAQLIALASPRSTGTVPPRCRESRLREP